MLQPKISREETIRRLREVAADEIKYFPGVLGNPVTFAARWGLPLSRSYLAFKARELADRKSPPVPGRAPRAGRSPVARRRRAAA